jgi:hypothetical protein
VSPVLSIIVPLAHPTTFATAANQHLLFLLISKHATLATFPTAWAVLLPTPAEVATLDFRSIIMVREAAVTSAR